MSGSRSEPTGGAAAVPERIWSSHLRIVAGRAVDDAPQVGFAESVDRLGRVVRLSVLAEAASAGGGAFIDQFVQRVCERFDPSVRSLTGALNTVIEAAHAELRAWNRQRLPDEQALYGLSCLIQRDDQPALLAQSGPSLALLAGEAGPADLRRIDLHRQLADASAATIGGGAPITVTFAAAPAASGWALLFTSNAALMLDAELRVALSRLAVEDTLRHLHPAMLHLRDAAAIAVGLVASPSEQAGEAPAEYHADADDHDDAGDADDPEHHLAANPGTPEADAKQLFAADRPGADAATGPIDDAGDAPGRSDRARFSLGEWRLSPAPAGALETAGWPINPFALTDVQLVGSAAPTAALPPARLGRPIVELSGALPSLLDWRREAGPEPPRIRRDDPHSRAATARRAGIVLAGMASVLLVVAAALLGPSLLQSDDDQFRSSLEGARTGLAASELVEGVESAQLTLRAALRDVETALELNPLAQEALQLRAEIESVLAELNLVQPPGELTTLVDLSSFGPAIALGSVRAGGGRTFVLDDAGGRVFAIDADAVAQVVFLEGESLGLSGQLRAGRPMSIAWHPRQPNASDGWLASDGLWILDSHGRLFRWTESGVLLVPIPERLRLGSVDAVAATAGSVYLLDRSGGAIWRFAVEHAELSQPTRSTGRTDLHDATELLARVNADGLVEFLVASEDGRLRRFLGDDALPLAVDLERGLLAPASLSSGAESELIYVVDRGRGRIVAVAQTGDVVSQIHAPELSRLRGAWVDETNGQIIYVLPDSLLVGRLPSWQEQP